MTDNLTAGQAVRRYKPRRSPVFRTCVVFEYRAIAREYAIDSLRLGELHRWPALNYLKS